MLFTAGYVLLSCGLSISCERRLAESFRSQHLLLLQPLGNASTLSQIELSTLPPNRTLLTCWQPHTLKRLSPLNTAHSSTRTQAVSKPSHHSVIFRVYRSRQKLLPRSFFSPLGIG
ncbi:hypothetical protein PoB_004120400 [Plakobranchus ocellatus]|uniref:Secreted protein n=1 Tax=Plakobranchus ocellatus TaxID=259542 RepID=A0AAV4B8N3_9GAST|nr:hypothetical protein PoB_004120400 [Plakobranchus ocellatus]